MTKNIILTALLLSIVLLFCACGGEGTDIPDTTDNTTDLTDTNDTADTTDNTDATDTIDTTDTADATDTPMSDSSDADAPDVTPSGISLPTRDEWDDMGYEGMDSDDIYNAVCALLSNDISAFEKEMSVKQGVYESFRGFEYDSYRIYCEEIRKDVGENGYTDIFPILELNITKGSGDFLTEGNHKIVFEAGLYLTFTEYDEFVKPYSSHEASPAEHYVNVVQSDRDFSSILSEGEWPFGLVNFIIGRLDTLERESGSRTREEICDYAEKYLGVDGDTLDFENIFLDKVDGGYIDTGHGWPFYASTFVSEKVTDGITVVTIQFWADYSRTVPSRLVEFHLELVDGEYRPIKTVILEDSDFDTVYYSA